MTRTLFVARLWFEGNRFSPLPTGLAEFRQREWLHGPAALQAADGTATELGAVAAWARANPGWRVVASRCASANPGGPIADAVFEAWLAEVLHDLRGIAPDAVLLSLHGAAITERRDTPERELIRAVRQQVGTEVPLGASFDLHANLAPADIEGLDFASAYRTYPHVDMAETAQRVLQHLQRLAEGRAPRLHGALARVGALLPSFRMRSDDEPMRSLLAQARARELEPGVHDASLFGGFPYADTPDTGASAMVWAASADQARQHAQALAGLMLARRAEFEPRLLPPSAALRAAAGLGPVIVAVTDAADNPLSGGALDTPGLFQALLALRRDPAEALSRWPASRVVFAAFADPAAVGRARALGAGAVGAFELGGRLSRDHGEPVHVQARVVACTEGRFVNEGPMERGCTVDLGPTAVLEVDGLRVILTSAVGAANDPGFFRLHGVELVPPLLLAVKAKNHFRAAFGPLCARILDADCPGPAAADLRSLPFRRARVGPPATAPSPSPS